MNNLENFRPYRPIGVDLFSGAGGLSLGFEQAGFDIVASVEVDLVHAATHKFNFPHCAVLPRSVVGLSGNEIREKAGIGNRPVDVVFGGAPCQGFSLIGHRAINDPRNHLVREFVRIVRELDASFFVFENVKGLTVGKHRSFLEEVIGVFSEIGYRIRLPWQVLNAFEYGVPQDRERLILLGAKEDFSLPEYPAPITRSAGTSKGLFSSPTGPSCLDALGDLPDAGEFSELFESDMVETDRWGKPSVYASRLRCMEESDWLFGYPRLEWKKTILTSSALTEHTKISKRRFERTEQGSVEPISRFFKLSACGISNTLRAGTDAARGAFTSPRPIHYEYPRCVTVREMARLHGFPDWFRFHTTKWHGARQVGNSVPPPLARAVASKIIEALGVSPAKPKDGFFLGDPALLQLDMSQAADHWGVPVIVVRRDRKSGSRKRKQEEIETSNAIDLQEVTSG